MVAQNSNVRGGEQPDGSLLYADVECEECHRPRCAARWEQTSEGIVLTQVGCPYCGRGRARLLAISRVHPQNNARLTVGTTDTVRDIGIGRMVACAVCHARYVREHEEMRCPNCGEKRPISVLADAARTQTPASSRAGSGTLAPCVNCGTMKPEKSPCPNCQKAS